MVSGCSHSRWPQPAWCCASAHCPNMVTHQILIAPQRRGTTRCDSVQCILGKAKGAAGRVLARCDRTRVGDRRGASVSFNTLPAATSCSAPVQLASHEGSCLWWPPQPDGSILLQRGKGKQIFGMSLSVHIRRTLQRHAEIGTFPTTLATRKLNRL